jgi:dihydroorotase
LEDKRVTIWVKGGEVVFPEKKTTEKVDIIIEKGKVSELMPHGKFKSNRERVKIIEASNKLVIPGLVDIHVHLREPGHEYKETIASGARAAVSGGITAMACMPNTSPPNDCRSVTEFILEQAERSRLARVYPVAAITIGQRGETLTEFGDLKSAGAVAVSDDGLPVSNSEVMRRAMEYAHYHGLLCISHCEDLRLSEGGSMHEGVVSTRIGLQGIPAACEEIMVHREISLSRLTGCPVHIAHVSTKGSVQLIKNAKEDGLPVTAETAPHYFTLDHNVVIGYDTNAKVNPPLRTPEDVQAIRNGLSKGIIDVIATDHAPHSPLEKDLEFDKAAFGISGLDTALPLILQLARDGILDLPDAIAKMTCNAASVLRVQGGKIEKGADADISIIDPEYEFELGGEDFVSKSNNSPFIGRRLKGRSLTTLIGGKVVWERKE